MIDAAGRVVDPAAVAEAPAPVFDNLTLRGAMNTDQAAVLAHVRHAIRLGWPQVSPQPPRPEEVAIVGGGPSLADTEHELVALSHAGAFVVAVNGSLKWLLERNIRPSAHVLLDARPSTAAFVGPAVPRCRTYVASQCHPDVFAALAGRALVGLFHAPGDDDAELRAILDAYYAGHWVGIGGGTTVALRAVGLLRTLGFLRFHLFGVDSCWMGTAHHAYAQPQNEGDRPMRVTVRPSAGGPGRDFTVSPWHLKQLEDTLQLIRAAGQHFLLHFHGDGLIAHALASQAELVVETGTDTHPHLAPPTDAGTAGAAASVTTLDRE